MPDVPEAGHVIGRQPAGRVVDVGMHHAALVGRAGRPAQPVVGGRGVVAVIGRDAPNLRARVLRKERQKGSDYFSSIAGCFGTEK